MFIDIHTHIDQYEPVDLDGLLGRARAAGVGCIIAAGTTVASSEKCVRLAHSAGSVLAGVGVHPQDLAGELTNADLDAIDRLATDPRVVAMSEVGLDYQETSPDRMLQERALRAQLEIARTRRLPVIFHMREATADTLRVLRETGAGALGGAAHYFQGNWSEAREVIDLGFKVSLAKPLLRLTDLKETARRIPLSEIVLETDAYPQYFKSKRERWTEPKDVRLVAARLAELQGVTIEEVEEKTTANALAMFGPKAQAVADVLRRSAEAGPA